MLNKAVSQKISKLVKSNFKDQTSFLASLVRARSSNPFPPEQLKISEPIEKKCAELIVKQLREFGLRPRLMGVSPARPNVVVYHGARRFRKSLMFNGHMDTAVPSEEYTLAPYSGAVREKKLYGVGSFDMKGTLSAYVFALKAIMDAGINLDGRLVLCFVVDEEPGGCSKLGTEFVLSKGIKTKAAIIGEPGSQKIAVGHRGGYRFKLVIQGEAVHTGIGAWERREKGRNAIVDMARVIMALQGLEIPFKPARAFPGRAPVFTFPVKIEGGQAVNVVPEKCTAWGDVRLLPGNSDKQVKLMMAEKLQQLGGINYDVEDILFVPSVEIDQKEEIVEILAENAKAVIGKRPVIEGAGPWNDAWMMIKRDIPTISGFGPDGGGAHEPDEWVDLNSLMKVTEVYAKVALDYLGIRK